MKTSCLDGQGVFCFYSAWLTFSTQGVGIQPMKNLMQSLTGSKVIFGIIAKAFAFTTPHSLT